MNKLEGDVYNVYLATRVAQWFNPVDQFLRWQLRSRYIHSEIVFIEKEFDYGSKKKNRSFSSRKRIRNCINCQSGVQFCRVKYHKNRWIFNKLFVDADVVWRRCKEIIGSGYDPLGAIGNCAFRLPLDKLEEFWCSESGAYAIQDYYPEFKKNDNLTPEELLYKVMDI